MEPGLPDRGGRCPGAALTVAAQSSPDVPAPVDTQLYARAMRSPGDRPVSFEPASIPWEPAAQDGTRAATLVGTRASGVQFTYAFAIPPLVFDKPHSHCADAHVFVASGELMLGYGESFEWSQLRRYPVGSFLWVPAGAVHFDGAETETVILGTATGPWSTDYADGCG